MNKHGQTLILFVILLPLILVLGALIVDIGLVMNNRIKLEEVTKSAVLEAYDDDIKIVEILQKNAIDISNIKMSRVDDKLKIEIKEEVKSIFGNIIGLKKYDLKISLVSYKDNNKIIFE